MAVELVNDGPFTIWLDTADRYGDTAAMAKPDALKRLGGGRWETKDGRFQIEPQSGTWVIVDTTQTNEFGLPLVRGPFPSLTAAKEAIETAREAGSGRIAAGGPDRQGDAAPATKPSKPAKSKPKAGERAPSPRPSREPEPPSRHRRPSRSGSATSARTTDARRPS